MNPSRSNTAGALLAIAGVLLSSAYLPAEEPTGQPLQRIVHRVTGLFSPDREADLRKSLEKIEGIRLVSLDFDHAEATFEYDPAKTFPGATPEQIVQRFNDLLRQASTHTLGIKPVCKVPRGQLTRVEIPIAGLDCRACCLAVYEILAQQDGVEQATASFKDGKATALIDPSKTDRAKLEAALKEREVPVPERT